MADKPETPDEGKPVDAEKAEVEGTEAKAAKGQKDAEATAAKPATAKRTRKKLAPEAAETAAAETGVDKAAAEALKAEPEAPAKPKRSRAKKADAEPTAEAEPKPKPKPKKAAAAKETPKAPEAAKPAAQPQRRRDRDGAEAVMVRAQARYVRTSARKARLICDHIRGKRVSEARAILAFSPRAVSEAWSKLLESAVANAENNHDLDGDDLRIAAIYADEGPTIKRYRPRAMGRATKIRKRTSHLSIALTPAEVMSGRARKEGKP